MDALVFGEKEFEHSEVYAFDSLLFSEGFDSISDCMFSVLPEERVQVDLSFLQRVLHLMRIIFPQTKYKQTTKIRNHQAIAEQSKVSPSRHPLHSPQR